MLFEDVLKWLVSKSTRNYTAKVLIIKSISRLPFYAIFSLDINCCIFMFTSVLTFITLCFAHRLLCSVQRMLACLLHELTSSIVPTVCLQILSQLPLANTGTDTSLCSKAKKKLGVCYQFRKPIQLLVYSKQDHRPFES